jgi:hypothetical protein
MSLIEVVEAELHGMRLQIARVPGAHVAAGVIEVDTGHGHDPLGHEGLAHLTEHVRATTATSIHGIKVSGQTEATLTRYAASSAHDGALHLAATLAAVLHPVRHDSVLHDSERNAVLIEMARQADRPQLRIAPAAAWAALPDSVHAITDVATPATVSAVTVDAVTDFGAAAYLSHRARLCLVSRHDPAHVLDTLAEHVSAGGPGGEPVLLPAAARGVTPGADPSTRAVVLVGPAAHGADQTRALAREAAVELLFGAGGALSAAAAAHGLTPIGYSLLPGLHADLGVLAWQLGDPDQVARFAADLRHLDPSRLDIAGVRRALRAGMRYEQASAGGLARQLMRYAAGAGPWPDPDAFVSVTDAHIVACCVQILLNIQLWVLAEGRAERTRVA